MKNRKPRKCKACGKYAVKSVVVDIDGLNLVDCEVCQECGEGRPELR